MSSFIERLENRIAPAGVITVSFKSGVLTVTGDAASNEVVVAPGANFGELNLSGTDGETFILNGQPAVSSIVLSTPLLKTAVFKLNAGDDDLTFNGVVVPVGLDLQLGAGADTVQFTSASVAGNLKIQGGTDTDTDRVDMDGSHFRLGGSLDFAVGNGQGLMFVSSDSNEIGGSVRFTGGKNLTQFDLGKASGQTLVGGSVLVKTQANANGYFNARGALFQVTGDLSIDHPAQASGGTSDRFAADRIEIGGMMKLKYGNGSHELVVDDLSVDSLTIGKGLEVTRGLNDSANFDIMPGALLIMGGVKASLPDASNELTLSPQDPGALHILGPVTVTGKGTVSFIGGGSISGPVKIAGTQVSLHGGSPESLKIGGSLTVTLMAQPAGPDLFMSRVDVAGNFTVAGTAMADGLTLNDLTVNGLTKIATLAGADIVRIDVSNVYSGMSRFFGAVSVLTGSEDDLIEFSGPNAGETAAFYSTVKIDTGTGANDMVSTTGSFFMTGQPVVI